MAFLAKGRKNDLIELAVELGEIVPPDAVIITIKNIIINSENYDETFVKQLLERVVEERIKREEKEYQEKLKHLEFQEQEKLKQMEFEDREKQRAFELQKLQFQSENRIELVTTNDNNVPEINKKNVDLRNVMQKFDLKEGEISSFLILFERQAKRVGLEDKDYVFHLLGLLPNEITQLIARESEDKANKYEYVKDLLLKRFKLSPEKFRQKFFSHVKELKSTWSDFVFEIRNYFDEWLEGLKIKDFDSLKELIITDQLKKRVPNIMREHFIDSWPDFVNANELAGKLDQYESVRSAIKIGNENKSNRNVSQYEDFRNPSRTINFRNSNSRRYDNNFEVKNQSYGFNEKEKSSLYNSYVRNRNQERGENRRSTNSRLDQKPSGASKDENDFCFSSSNCKQKGVNAGRKMNTNENESSSRFNKFYLPIYDENNDPKCFSCNEYGHISKDCPYPCNLCGGKGHIRRNCPKHKSDSKKESSLNINDLESCADADKYLRSAIINNSSVGILCDTGASSCLLKESTAKRLKLNVSPCKKEIHSFGGQISHSLGSAILDMQIGEVIGKDIPVLIMADHVQSVELIVGRTFLDLPYVAFSKVGDVFHIGYAKDYPFNGLNCFEETQCIKLQADEATKIVNNSVNFVRVKTDQMTDGLILIKGKESNFDSLLEVKEGQTIMPIINVGNEYVTFNKNQRVGKAEIINELDIVANSNSFNDNRSLEVFNVNEINVERKPITIEQIKLSENLTEQQQQDIVKLVNEYRDCFALNISELGCTDLIKMDIKEIEGSKPVCMKPYKTNATERQAIKEIVNEWKENGIVKETRSPYSSPVLLVRKKTGENRLVIDYRKLNNQTIKDKFPLPKIDDLLEQLHDCCLFCCLDLAHGFLQIPLTEEAKLKTAFITPDETGQFERMIFGLTNAPSEFQRLMYLALKNLCNKDVLCYLDDILVHAKTWEEMISKLIKVFKALREASLTLKLTKCEFARNEVEFLGFIINKDGIRPGTRKIEVISKFPEPKNLHEIRRFLGLTSFFRRFIQSYAIKAKPLTELTKKGEEFKWGVEQKKSFETLKNELVHQPTLALYNPEAKTEVHTDASADGIAGMLLQIGTDNKWHLVYCVSKKTTEPERNYHSSKLELMAIVWTLERLRQFLIGIDFTVVTDCQALIYMNAKKSSNPQIARWSILIQEYNFEVRHRPGAKMSHIDALSRAPVLDPDDTMTNLIERKFEVYLTLSEDDQILIIQNADKDLRKLIDIFKKEAHERTTEEKQKINSYVFKRNRLYRRTMEKGKEKLLYVIPKSMRKSTTIKFHDLMGHFSLDRTVDKIKELYWFPYMRRYVRKHIAMCFECLLNKTPGGKQQGKLHPIKPGRRPFSVIHLDHLGPFVKSSKGNKDLLVIIDNFTRFTRLFPVKNTASQHVLKAMEAFVQEFGLPDRIISDRGSCYTAHEFEQYCNDNGIHHTLNSTQHRRANGMVERANRTIISTITTSMEDSRHKDWDLRIKEVERNLNNTVNNTTDKTPFELLHGYSPRFNDGLLRMVADESADAYTDPKEIQTKTRSVIREKQRKMKDYHDKKKCRTVTYDPGEIVVVRRSPKSTGQSAKTQPKYRGPLIITEVLPGDTYRVTQLEEKKKGHFYCTTAHVSQLKPWRLYPDSNDLSESE